MDQLDKQNNILWKTMCDHARLLNICIVWLSNRELTLPMLIDQNLFLKPVHTSIRTSLTELYWSSFHSKIV